MNLGTPLVVAPVTACNTAVQVQGQLPGATVDVYAGTPPFGQVPRHVGGGIVDSADALVSLTPGVHLVPGERLVAAQKLGSDVSRLLSTELGVEVGVPPDGDDLAGLFCGETPLQCGTCVWVEGVWPGATVSFTRNGGPPLSVETNAARAKFVLPSGESFSPTDALVATQTACEVVGPSVALAAPVEQFRSEWPVAAPTVATPLLKCQRSIYLTDVVPGATIVVERVGDEERACFGYRQGAFHLSRRLDAGDTLRVWQEFPECELVSAIAEHDVLDKNPTPPSVCPPLCEGDRFVDVAGLRKEALVEFGTGDGEPLWRAAAPCDGTATFGVPSFPSLVGRGELTVRQSLCDGAAGTWSDWSAPCPVRALSPQPRPSIVERVFGGGVAVGVAGLLRGTWVTVMSDRQGPIGTARSTGDLRTDVPLWWPLIAGDTIWLATIRCGARVDHQLAAAIVVRYPEDPQPPTVADPACDCGGSVAIIGVAHGAIVELYRLHSATSKSLVGTYRAGAANVSVDVPPLQGGEQLVATQRVIAQRSAPGPAATVPDLPPWSYHYGSAFRLCQWTQDSDPGHPPRPHAVGTTQFGLTGTDLGVAVDHGGLLNLFFGDATDSDADPIALVKTTDPFELEDRAPDLQWVVGTDGAFQPLLVEGETLGNFEVPTGGFSYDGRLYVFIGRNKFENPSRMTVSELVVRADPDWSFRLTMQISSTTGSQILVLDPDGSIHPEPYPGRRWMLHISPTVVSNADWPGLPASGGDGLLMFGSSAYRGGPDATPEELKAGNVYLAWAPLTPGVPFRHPPIPQPDQWLFFVGLNKHGQPTWRTLSVLTLSKAPPVPILPVDGLGPRLLGEISVVWYPELRRWILAGSAPQAQINVARQPWGPWTPSNFICDASKTGFDAGNLKDEWTDSKITYAPYLIRRWVRWDRSARYALLYFTLSGFDDRPGKPKYQPQLIRSQIDCNLFDPLE